jgi:hypothetical protein
MQANDGGSRDGYVASPNSGLRTESLDGGLLCFASDGEE